MSRERIDHETMAAFLDGKLAGAERERVLQAIAAHPEEYEVFADAARAAAELRGGDVLPIESRRRSGSWKVAVPLLVAAGLGALAVGALTFLKPNQNTTPSFLALASELGTPDDSGWSVPPWSSRRGEAMSLSDRSAAFRIGARLVDLEVSARNTSPEVSRQIALDLAELSSSLLAGSAVAGGFERIAADSTRDADLRAETAAAVVRLLEDSPWLRGGAWLEAGRVATMTRNLGFFTTGHPSQDRLEQLIDALTLASRPGDPDLLPGLLRVRDAVRTGVSLESLPALGLLLDSLLAQGAR